MWSFLQPRWFHRCSGSFCAKGASVIGEVSWSSCSTYLASGDEKGCFLVISDVFEICWNGFLVVFLVYERASWRQRLFDQWLRKLTILHGLCVSIWFAALSGLEALKSRVYAVRFRNSQVSDCQLSFPRINSCCRLVLVLPIWKWFFFGSILVTHLWVKSYLSTGHARWGSWVFRAKPAAMARPRVRKRAMAWASRAHWCSLLKVGGQFEPENLPFSCKLMLLCFFFGAHFAGCRAFALSQDFKGVKEVREN